MSVPASAQTLPGFAESLRQRGYTDSTIRQYVRVVRRWRASRLTPEAWLRAQAGPGLPSVSAKCYEAGLLAWARFSGEAPPAKLPRPLRYRKVRPPQDALTRAEEARFRGALAHAPEPARTLLRLILDTGARIDEIRTLKLADVKVAPTGASLDIVGKGVKRRIVPLPPATSGALADYLRDARGPSRTPWVFPGAAAWSVPVHASTIRDALAKIKGEAAISARLTPHTLRHTRATRLMEAGVHERVAAALLGHSIPGVHAQYQHPTVGMLLEGLARSI